MDLELLQISHQRGAISGLIQRLRTSRDIPGGEENPWQSDSWLRPHRVALWEAGHLQERIVDYCACGRPVRGRTRWRFWRCRPDPFLAKLRCVGRRNICSYSGKPHVELTGKGQGQFPATLKNADPPFLCSLLASTLRQSSTQRKISTKWYFLNDVNS